MKKASRKILLILLTLIFCLSASVHLACAPCEHKFNGGELITPATANDDGKIKYTCTLCGNKKEEVVPAGTKLLTRKEAEDALVSVAWAYLAKGTKLQYDSAALSKVSHWYGGNSRITRYKSPEYGTSDTTIYSVCSTYTCDVYLEALGRRVWEADYGPNSITTQWLFLAADNQVENNYKTSEGLDPITEKDKDTAILRWVDYEKYKVDNPTDLPHADRMGTFNSSSFTDWHKDGKLQFKKTADGYEYVLDGKAITSQEAKGLASQYLREQVDGKYVNIRPGDMLVNEDHAEIYVGNGYVLDCAGAKYDIEKGTDKVESKGSVSRLHTVESVVASAKNVLTIIRPLDFYMTDCDGNPDNDVMTYDGKPLSIPDATYSRMNYEMMDIDRTVDVSPYGSVVNGDNVTYSVKITNKSNTFLYTTWKQVTENDFYGKDYENVKIAEAIPTGTEFVSASEGYTLKDGVLSWTVDIPASDTVEVTYTVKVTADAGTTIVNDGGYVADIPSNTLENKVVKAKLSDANQSILLGLEESNVNEWVNKYGTDLDFAEGIYKEMGINLELPKVSDIIKNVFTPTLFNGFPSSRHYLEDLDLNAVMFTFNDEVSSDYLSIKNMLVENYWGGYRFYGADYDKLKNDIANFDYTTDMDNCVKDLSFNNLEIGDILVFATAKDRGDTTMTHETGLTRVFVYAGSKTLLEMNSSSGGTVYSGISAEEVIVSTFKDTNDLFFVLRPSQSIDLSTNA